VVEFAATPFAGETISPGSPLPSEGRVLVRPLHSLSRFDEAIEAVMASLESGAGAAYFLGVRPAELDEAVDRVVRARMESAPSDSIRASYRVLLGRVGIAFARLAFRRLKTALNSARFAAVSGPAPRLAVLGAGADAGRLFEALHHEDVLFVLGDRARREVEGRVLRGPGIDGEYAEAKMTIDKLANYQIDLGAVAADLERIA
jgi:hypothetical protein